VPVSISLEVDDSNDRSRAVTERKAALVSHHPAESSASTRNCDQKSSNSLHESDAAVVVGENVVDVVLEATSGFLHQPAEATEDGFLTWNPSGVGWLAYQTRKGQLGG
jgi:hypothetical protein